MHHSEVTLIWTSVVVEGDIMTITYSLFGHERHHTASLLRSKTQQVCRRRITCVGDTFLSDADGLKRYLYIYSIPVIVDDMISVLNANKGALFSG